MTVIGTASKADRAERHWVQLLVLPPGRLRGNADKRWGPQPMTADGESAWTVKGARWKRDGRHFAYTVRLRGSPLIREVTEAVAVEWCIDPGYPPDALYHATRVVRRRLVGVASWRSRAVPSWSRSRCQRQ